MTRLAVADNHATYVNVEYKPTMHYAQNTGSTLNLFMYMKTNFVHL